MRRYLVIRDAAGCAPCVVGDCEASSPAAALMMYEDSLMVTHYAMTPDEWKAFGGAQ